VPDTNDDRYSYALGNCLTRLPAQTTLKTEDTPVEMESGNTRLVQYSVEYPRDLLDTRSAQPATAVRPLRLVISTVTHASYASSTSMSFVCLLVLKA
jgi:hypothetical protein